jgi:hypothetical protein
MDHEEICVGFGTLGRRLPAAAARPKVTVLNIKTYSGAKF